MIVVVAAVIRRGESVLLCQRPQGGHLAGRWEFPGGKLERGESPERALERELSEELGVTARAGQILCALPTVHPDGREIMLLFYETAILTGEPQPIEEAQVRYVPLNELEDYDLCDADGDFAERCLIGR